MFIKDMDIPGWRLHTKVIMPDNYDLWKARKEVDLNNYNTIEYAV